MSKYILQSLLAGMILNLHLINIVCNYNNNNIPLVNAKKLMLKLKKTQNKSKFHPSGWARFGARAAIPLMYITLRRNPHTRYGLLRPSSSRITNVTSDLTPALQIPLRKWATPTLEAMLNNWFLCLLAFLKRIDTSGTPRKLIPELETGGGKEKGKEGARKKEVFIISDGHHVSHSRSTTYSAAEGVEVPFTLSPDLPGPEVPLSIELVEGGWMKKVFGLKAAIDDVEANGVERALYGEATRIFQKIPLGGITLTGNIMNFRLKDDLYKELGFMPNCKFLIKKGDEKFYITIHT